jgi:hypothetical protein
VGRASLAVATPMRVLGSLARGRDQTSRNSPAARLQGMRASTWDVRHRSDCRRCRTGSHPFRCGAASGTVTGTRVLDAVRGLPGHRFSIRHFGDGDRIELARDLFGTLGLGFVVLARSGRDQVPADCAKVRGLEPGLIVRLIGPAGPRITPVA